MDIGYSHRASVILMYAWTCVLAFGGLAFAIFPWQLVLAADVAAAAVMAVVTAWPYLRDKAPGPGPRSEGEYEAEAEAAGQE
jgi:UDP-GlcNAc:undecaprenyl-phosphate GlcNAc-1-phosphate transferase